MPNVQQNSRPNQSEIPLGESQHRPRRRRSFWTNIDAAVVRELGKNAAVLYYALMRLADGSSGQLQIRGQWLKAIRFDREAHMCKRVRLAAMRELMANGLVTIERPRVYRIIDGRLRAVGGPVHYTVHRQPVDPKNRQIPEDSSKVPLQKCISGTVQEMHPQDLPETPSVVAGPVSALPSSSVSANGHRHQHPEIDDDDCHVDEKSKPKSKTKPPLRGSELPPALRAWMNTRILARGRDVKSCSAYLWASEPAFLENLDDEIECYLVEQAQNFMRQGTRHTRLLKTCDVHDFLETEAKRNGLQINDLDIDQCSFLGRVIDNAAEILGLVETENAMLREKPNPVAGPRGPDHRYAHLVKDRTN